jgi:hypothetical protein
VRAEGLALNGRLDVLSRAVLIQEINQLDKEVIAMAQRQERFDWPAKERIDETFQVHELAPFGGSGTSACRRA